MDSRGIAGVKCIALVDQRDVQRRTMKDQFDNNDGEISDRQGSPEVDFFPSRK